MSSHAEIIASITCQMPIKPLHATPTVAQKAVVGGEEDHQSNYPHQGIWKAIPDICPVDALGIKLEDLLNLYLYSKNWECFHIRYIGGAKHKQQY